MSRRRRFAILFPPRTAAGPPAALLSSAAWYDPSDFSTLFQDSAGTTPVTAVEQPVGLMRSKGSTAAHASQATSASRPVLRARYNLLTYSEQFDNAAWVKVNATYIADTLTATASGGKLQQNTTVQAGSTVVIDVQKGTADVVIVDNGLSGANDVTDFNLSSLSFVLRSNNAAASIADVGGGVIRLTVTRGATSGNRISLNVPTSGQTVIPLRASLLSADDHAATGGAYQRVGAATDYDTSNSVWRPYLAPDGVDDWMPTSPLLNLGETWWHVGGWRSDVAGRRAFATSASFAGALRDSGGAWRWRDNSNANPALGADLSLATGSPAATAVVTVQQTNTGALQGRYNGVSGSQIVPYDDSGLAQGLALFSQDHVAWGNGISGRFYGGAWWLVPPSEADQAAVEAWMAAKAGVTLP